MALLLLANSAQAAFEPRTVGARAAGLAEAYTTVADDLLSLYYNPAGLEHIRRPEIGSHFSKLFMGLDDKSEVSTSFFGYAHPLPKKFGVGLKMVPSSVALICARVPVSVTIEVPLPETMAPLVPGETSRIP